MKYLCLVYIEENKLAAVNPSDPDALDDDECVVYNETLRKRGLCLASEALQPAQTATTVRVRNGKVSVIDGPFAETKEFLGGFYLIEARDLDAALEAAARLPSAKWGKIEVRPIWEEPANADAAAAELSSAMSGRTS
jgi:hypothetical protein